MNTRIVGPVLVGLGLALGLAGHAVAQERPTLERIETVMCQQATLANETYRPSFCQPICQCDLPGSAESCVETSPGEVVVLAEVVPNYGAAWCYGSCTSDPQIRCIGSLECLSAGAGVCIFPGGVCAEPNMPCFSDAGCDQARGYTCDLALNRCTGAACSSEGFCDVVVDSRSGVQTVQLAAASKETPRSCEVIDGFDGSSSVVLLSGPDAGQCIEDAEALIGPNACAICGDGATDAGEQCDDGNLDPGDGCDANCQNESP